MSTDYEPALGSLGATVVAYFRRPDAQPELTQEEIVTKFPPTKYASISGCLMSCVTNGLLARVRNSAGVIVYRPGPHLSRRPAAANAITNTAAGAPTSAHAAPPPASVPTTGQAGTKRPSGRGRSRLPDLDLDAIEVHEGVPLPESNQSGRGRSKYNDLFDRLARPNTSVEVPAAYKAAVQKASIVYRRLHPERVILVRGVPNRPDLCGIWRMADKATAANASATKPAR